MELNYTVNDLDKIAKQLLNTVTSKIILFHGTMGVGKTTLIKALVKNLGCTDDVQSPTYSIVNEYQINDGLIYHFDLYRINSLEEAYNFGIEDYLYSNNWIFIEWPELICEILPEDTNEIFLSLNSDGTRTLKL